MRALLLVFAIALAGCGSKTALAGEDRGGGGGPGAGGRDGSVPVRADAASVDGSERCDGRDEDGDGRIDEGIGDVRCGRGACFASVPGCVDGETPLCVPGAPSPEVCNEIDDDCDGRVDEGLPGSRLSEPIILRDVGEGTTGDCAVCDRAFGPTILPIEDGLLALWQLDFLFVDRRPNTFVRMLDTTGAPREPVRLMFDTNTTFGMRATPIRDGRSLVTYCERFADGTDHPGSVMIDATGRALGEPFVYDEDDRCTVGVPPVALWLGDRHLIAYSLGASVGPRRFRTVVADAEGVPTRPIHVLGFDPLGARPPIDLFLREGEPFFVSGGTLGFLTRDGQLAAPVERLPVSVFTTRSALVPTSFGYRLFTVVERDIDDGPVRRVVYSVQEIQLDPAGDPLGAVRELGELGELIAAGGRGDDGAILIVRDPGMDPLNTLDDATLVLELAADGAEVSRTAIPVEDEGTWQDLRFVDNGGQKLMVYVVRDDGRRNHTQVRLRRYGCDP